eukprot:407053_1
MLCRKLTHTRRAGVLFIVLLVLFCIIFNIKLSIKTQLQTTVVATPTTQSKASGTEPHLVQNQLGQYLRHRNDKITSNVRTVSAQQIIELAINSTTNETKTIKHSNISRIIFTSWKRFNTREDMIALCVWAQQWNAVVKGDVQNLKYFDHVHLRKFMVQHFNEWFVDDHFNDLSDITRSDVFRLAALFKYGGVWADFDAFPNTVALVDDWITSYVPLDILATNSKIECIFGLETSGIGNLTRDSPDFDIDSRRHIILIANYLFACQPRHIILKNALNTAMYKTQIKAMHTLKSAGPHMVQNEILKYVYDTTNAKQAEHQLYEHFHTQNNPFLLKRNVLILNTCAIAYDCSKYNRVAYHRFMGSWNKKVSLLNETTFQYSFFRTQPKLNRTKCTELVDKMYG